MVTTQHMPRSSPLSSSAPCRRVARRLPRPLGGAPKGAAGPNPTPCAGDLLPALLRGVGERRCALRPSLSAFAPAHAGEHAPLRVMFLGPGGVALCCSPVPSSDARPPPRASPVGRRPTLRGRSLNVPSPAFLLVQDLSVPIIRRGVLNTLRMENTGGSNGGTSGCIAGVGERPCAPRPNSTQG